MTSRELYALGLVLERESGAIVAVEKRPRKSGRVERGVEMYEDVLHLAFVERLSGSMTDMLARAATLLDCERSTETP